MKTIKLVLVLILAGTLSAFAQNKTINVDKSSVKWTGNKITGSHNGDIKVKSGSFDFTDGNITKGEIVIDINSITCADLEDASYNKKLVGHLKSDDFFGTEKFPTATFVVTKASKFVNNKASVIGKITIKGKTETITFDVMNNSGVYTAQLKIDRTKFGIRYGSDSFFDNLGDKAIENIFILDIKLMM